MGERHQFLQSLSQCSIISYAYNGFNKRVFLVEAFYQHKANERQSCLFCFRGIRKSESLIIKDVHSPNIISPLISQHFSGDLAYIGFQVN